HLLRLDVPPCSAFRRDQLGPATCPSRRVGLGILSLCDLSASRPRLEPRARCPAPRRALRALSASRAARWRRRLGTLWISLGYRTLPNPSFPRHYAVLARLDRLAQARAQLAVPCLRFIGYAASLTRRLALVRPQPQHLPSLHPLPRQLLARLLRRQHR